MGDVLRKRIRNFKPYSPKSFFLPTWEVYKLSDSTLSNLCQTRRGSNSLFSQYSSIIYVIGLRVLIIKQIFSVSEEVSINTKCKVRKLFISKLVNRTPSVVRTYTATWFVCFPWRDLPQRNVFHGKCLLKIYFISKLVLRSSVSPIDFSLIICPLQPNLIWDRTLLALLLTFRQWLPFTRGPWREALERVGGPARVVGRRAATAGKGAGVGQGKLCSEPGALKLVKRAL